MSIPKRMPSFISHVFVVVWNCSKPKMLWIAAWRIVARMENIKSIWNQGIKSLKRIFVSKILLSEQSHSTIFSFAPFSHPKPTVIRFFNSFPKSRNCVYLLELYRAYFTACDGILGSPIEELNIANWTNKFLFGITGAYRGLFVHKSWCRGPEVIASRADLFNGYYQFSEACQ